MANSDGAARYNQPVKYTKTLTLTMADGETQQFTGPQAVRIQKYLEDSARFIYTVSNDLKTKTFYALSQNGCGFCKVAEFVSGAEATTPATCENGIPNCPNDDLDPTTPSITLNTGYEEVKVGSTITLTPVVVPAGTAVTWASADTATATVAAGVVTGVKAGTTTITATAGTASAKVTINVLAA